MNEFTAVCIHCKSNFNVPAENNGKLMKCTECNKKFIARNLQYKESNMPQKQIPTQTVPNRYVATVQIKTKQNRMERVFLSGGLIGALTTNPKSAIEGKIKILNTQGWNCRQILPHGTHNLFITIVQTIILVCTLGLWTFGGGYLLLFEKEVN